MIEFVKVRRGIYTTNQENRVNKIIKNMVKKRSKKSSSNKSSEELVNYKISQYFVVNLYCLILYF